MNWKLFVLTLSFFSGVIIGCNQDDTRLTTSLNGEWDIVANTNPDQIPDNFTSKIAVPGLVDLAIPALNTIGQKNDSGVYYWYRLKFKTPKNALVNILKIHKAQYGKKIFINGQLVCEHFYSYTPLYQDITKYLNPAGAENELIIRIGNYYNFPDSLVNGHDFEKIRFIAGIYDHVELIQTGLPLIQNVQIAPDIEKGEITVVAELNTTGFQGKTPIKYQVCEHLSKKIIAEGKIALQATGTIDTLKTKITIPQFQLWSPASPFLYELKLVTKSDDCTTRFGMREFHFDQATGKAILNGQIYYLKGTNVPVFRFYEDSLRGDRPWNKEWVSLLYSQFKSMNWQVIRFHVGPAPDFWYDMADEKGFLIQDEFAVWFGYGMKGIRPNLKAANLAAEYKEWMRERWNHPCVVIWDAQNETVTTETGKAINMVRHLDLSNRPWDNGWSRPQSPTDGIECHPYLFYAYREKVEKLPDEGILKSLMGVVREANNDCGQHDPSPDGNYTNARFINEYGWLWVNRDGSATTLSDEVYKNLYGDTLTNQQRLYAYARVEAMLTEYWRCHRICSGVMHFAGLTYSRPAEPRGQTSDNFANIETLEFETNFVKYVKPAFSDVALMLDTWEKQYAAGKTIEIPVYLINDLYEDWKGELTVSVTLYDQVVTTQTKLVTIPSLGKIIEPIKIEIPKKKGPYQLKASIIYNNSEVISLRDLRVE